MNTTPSVKFVPYALISLLGVGVLISPYVVGLPEGVEQAKEASKIEAAEQLERTAIEQQALTSKLLREKEQVRNEKNLIINNYGYDSKTPPNLGRSTITRYPNTMKVLVYDREGYCVGVIENKKFRFRGDVPRVCNNVTDVKVD